MVILGFSIQVWLPVKDYFRTQVQMCSLHCKSYIGIHLRLCFPRILQTSLPLHEQTMTTYITKLTIRTFIILCKQIFHVQTQKIHTHTHTLPVGGKMFFTKMKIAFSGLSLILFLTTYTNCPTVKSAGTRYLQSSKRTII